VHSSRARGIRGRCETCLYPKKTLNNSQSDPTRSPLVSAKPTLNHRPLAFVRVAGHRFRSSSRGAKIVWLRKEQHVTVLLPPSPRQPHPAFAILPCRLSPPPAPFVLRSLAHSHLKSRVSSSPWAIRPKSLVVKPSPTYIRHHLLPTSHRRTHLPNIPLSHNRANITPQPLLHPSAASRMLQGVPCGSSLSRALRAAQP